MEHSSLLLSSLFLRLRDDDFFFFSFLFFFLDDVVLFASSIVIEESDDIVGIVVSLLFGILFSVVVLSLLDEYDFISCGKNSKVLQEKLYELWLVLSKIQEDEQMIKEKMITGMANILFNNIKNVKCIDIWMFKKNLNISRSGMDIDCAKAINRNQVDDLYTYF